MEQYKEGQPVIEMQQQEEGRGAWLKLLIPQQGYFITPILIYLNFIVFGIMVFNGVHFMEPESADLIKWGATNRVLVLQGDYWRLLSSCFVHIGVIHLLLNMYALLMIGALLEGLLGSWRFLSAYLVTGIAASVTSIYWHENSAGAGASGAIFGMYGLFLALLTTNLIERNARKELLSSIGLFVVYNLAFGLKGGIDNAAHIGGLVSGMVFGYVVTPALRKPERNQLGIALTIGASVCVLGISAF